MRITILTNDHPDRPHGGTATIVASHAELLRGHGHDVSIISPVSDAWRVRSILGRLIFHIQDLGIDHALANKIQETRPDVLITENVTGCGWGTATEVQRYFRVGSTGFCGYALAKCPPPKEVKWIHILHDVAMFEPSGQIIVGELCAMLRRTWRRFWAKQRVRALGLPSIVISPTKWLADQHQSFGCFIDQQIAIIPNPLPSFRHPRAGENPPLLKKEQTVLFVGRCDADKGLPDLLRAWTSMPEGWSLRIIGSGSLVSQLQSLTDSSIQYLGSKSHDEVMQEMLRASMVIVPSRVAENQPTVILEALACGANVVATSVGGIPETLQGNGCLVAPHDPTALRNAIIETMAREPRVLSLDRYLPEVIGRELDAVVRSNR